MLRVHGLDACPFMPTLLFIFYFLIVEQILQSFYNLWDGLAAHGPAPRR